MPKKKFNPIVKIGKRKIGPGHPCFIIAEAGSNHNRKYPWAKKLISVAAKAQADAVKFQLFTPEKIYVVNAGSADYLGDKQSIQEIFHEIKMPEKWIPKLASFCKQKGILFLCSVFDEVSADIVDPYVDLHKIASYEITHIPLIKHIAKKGKSIILSTAMADVQEIDEALETIASTGNRNVILMHCVAKYPAPLKDSNLRAILTLQKRYNIPVGLSDHSREPLINPLAVVALGGNAIEKHFTLSNDLEGPDHKFALEPEELEEMVSDIKKVEIALGSSEKKRLPIEKELYLFARRHIHAIRNIKKGEVYTTQNVAVLRSGKVKPGIDPKYFDAVLGQRAAKDIAKGEGITSENCI